MGIEVWKDGLWICRDERYTATATFMWDRDDFRWVVHVWNHKESRTEDPDDRAVPLHPGSNCRFCERKVKVTDTPVRVCIKCHDRIVTANRKLDDAQPLTS